MSDDIPTGLPFSRAYLRPAQELKDDPKFRMRLSALFYRLGFQDVDMDSHLLLRAGIETPRVIGTPDWEQFFRRIPIDDLLDAIGHFYNRLLNSHPLAAESWKKGVALILKEQAMAYRLDEACAVRKLVDKEFDRTLGAAIAGLGRPRYKVAKGYFEDAIAALEVTPPDTAGMVRNIFMANEELFKLMFPKADRLAAGNVRDHLLPEGNFRTQSAITAAKEMANSFAKWVAACQQYRHAPGENHVGEESTAAPPLDLAIVMMSNGASFLRWLIAQDKD